MRLQVEAKKIEAKAEMTEIETWNAEIDAQLEKADLEVKKVLKWIEDRKREAEALVQEEQLKRLSV